MSVEMKPTTGPSLRITNKQVWWNVNWVELWRYRDLIFLFVRRDFVAYYKQTILGPLWFLLQPLMTTIVFTVCFGKIAKISTDGIPQPLFYLSGIILWGYFAACLNGTSNTFAGNAHIFGKVYFPRLCIPIGVVISNLLQFTIQFGLFMVFYAYDSFHGAQVHANVYVLLLPIILFQMALLGLGCGILVSSLTTTYRDLALAVSLGVQLWFYLTPIAYPSSLIPLKYQSVFFLNPMVGVVEVFRYAFLGGEVFQWEHVLISWGITIGVFTFGVLMFHRVEKSFMDTV